MNKKQKTIIIGLFALILVIFGGAAAALNYQKTQAGLKHFTVEVISERDAYSQTTECQSELEFLGEFMREFEGCHWQESDYGIYITGFHDMNEDAANQYWWCVLVNGQSAVSGADQIPLNSGDTYTFQLKQGW